MKSALALVLAAYALLLAYLLVGGLALSWLRTRILPPVSSGDVAAAVLILLYGYVVYKIGKRLAQARCGD